jgi:D-glycero-D-manno-heptose 1,7-bisphosphate phosphatase
MALRPAVFLDRDGTLNVQMVRGGMPYAPVRLEDFRLFDGAPEACRALKAAGYALVVATNQPDVGRGEVAQSVIESMNALLLERIPELDRIEVCYDPGRGETSRRRKPEPGMLLDAAAALGIDLSRSWMVGDRWRDVECGRRAGVRTVFIDFGYSDEVGSVPDFTVKSIGEAVAVIIAAGRAPSPGSPPGSRTSS